MLDKPAYQVANPPDALSKMLVFHDHGNQGVERGNQKKKKMEITGELRSLLMQACTTAAFQDGFGFTSTAIAVLPPFSHEWKQTGYRIVPKQEET